MNTNLILALCAMLFMAFMFADDLLAGEADFGGAFDEEEEQQNAGAEGVGESGAAAEGEGQGAAEGAGSTEGAGAIEADEATILADLRAKHPTLFAKYDALETEKADLAKQLAEKTKVQPATEGASSDDSDPFAEAPEELKAYLEEYPETREVARMMAEHQIKQMFGGDPADMINRFAQVTGQIQFENAVMNGFMDDKGEYVEGHPDLHKIVLGPHKELYTKFLTDNKIDANAINDPKEAIRILSDFKTKSLTPFLANAGKSNADRAARGEELMRQAGAALGPANGSRGATEKRSGNSSGAQLEDFDSAFAEA